MSSTSHNYHPVQLKQMTRSTAAELRLPGLPYLPPAENIDNDISEHLDRRKRVLVFRPLFIYRQQQIKKMRVPLKPLRKVHKITTTTQRPTTTTTATPGYAYNHSNYAESYYYHSSPDYPYYVEIAPPYYRPQPNRPLSNSRPYAVSSYPRPEYPAKYPTYVWSNYDVDSPNRRSGM